MTDYLFLAIGAIIGVIAGFISTDKTPIHRIESFAVGVFGAFAGGELLFNAIGRPGGGAPGQASMISTMLAIGVCVGMLLLLSFFRGAVGPLRSGKSRQRER